MTQNTLPRVAQRPAPPALWRGLLDDAAVFPPGSTPWRQALPQHIGHRTAWYAECIGPLLLPVPVIAELAEEPPALPFHLGLIARPGTPLGEARHALEVAAGIRGVTTVAAEIPYGDSWREALDWDVPLAVEIPADGDIKAAVRDLADAGTGVRAKLRTGATSTIAPPTPAQFARFLIACAAHGVPAKLTGGLHHAAGSGDEYGFLAVLLAARTAAAGGTPDAVAHQLGERDPSRLAGGILALEDEDIRAARALLTSYGCCTVHDPLRDLLALGLMEGQL